MQKPPQTPGTWNLKPGTNRPSTLNPKPSTQVDLFNYLKPAQREAIRPYLRIVKPQYQEALCVSLLDYLEGHGLNTLQQPVLNMLQEEIVQVCGLHPLTTRQPKSIGTWVKQLFPNLSNLSNPSNL